MISSKKSKAGIKFAIISGVTLQVVALKSILKKYEFIGKKKFIPFLFYENYFDWIVFIQSVDNWEK